MGLKEQITNILDVLVTVSPTLDTNEWRKQRIHRYEDEAVCSTIKYKRRLDLASRQ